MFYNDDLLRKDSSISLVWLAATVGNRTGTKLLGRKNVLDMNVPATCDYLRNPPEPYSLRLFANMTFGVVKLYSLQQNFFREDLKKLHVTISRHVFRSSAIEDLNLSVKPIKSQLNLLEDPNFMKLSAYINPHILSEISDDSFSLLESQDILPSSAIKRIDSIEPDSVEFPRQELGNEMNFYSDGIDNDNEGFGPLKENEFEFDLFENQSNAILPGLQTIREARVSSDTLLTKDVNTTPALNEKKIQVIDSNQSQIFAEDFDLSSPENHLKYPIIHSNSTISRKRALQIDEILEISDVILRLCRDDYVKLMLQAKSKRSRTNTFKQTLNFANFQYLNKNILLAKTLQSNVASYVVNISYESMISHSSQPVVVHNVENIQDYEIEAGRKNSSFMDPSNDLQTPSTSRMPWDIMPLSEQRNSLLMTNSLQEKSGDNERRLSYIKTPQSFERFSVFKNSLKKRSSLFQRQLESSNFGSLDEQSDFMDTSFSEPKDQNDEYVLFRTDSSKKYITKQISILDTESKNFFTFLSSKCTMHEEHRGFGVNFDDILDCSNNDKTMIAANAFYQLLHLASNSLLKIHQNGPYEPIRITM